MLKSSGSGDIFNRLYNKKGGVPSDDQTNLIMENIYFLNRNCKCNPSFLPFLTSLSPVLSFAEKENLIHLLKKRDPEVEEIIHDFKENKGILPCGDPLINHFQCSLKRKNERSLVCSPLSQEIHQGKPRLPLS